jgi:hypothetical protein
MVTVVASAEELAAKTRVGEAGAMNDTNTTTFARQRKKCLKLTMGYLLSNYFGDLQGEMYITYETPVII